MTRFIGREEELEMLCSLLGKKSASFVVIRGRRRIGKSRLIREFGKSVPCHVFSGIPPDDETTKQSQINDFCRQMERAFKTPELHVKDWGAVFWQLGQLCAHGRIMIALDEISWIGSKSHDFLGQLKNAWDLYFSQNPELILIVCGSVSSWIEKNILSSTGFVGRISLNMRLEELPISDAVKFWGAAKKRTSFHDMVSVLGVTGGVPRYLEEVRPELSADENIRRLCFDRSGLLYEEFDRIFSDLFSSKASLYAEIARTLSDGPCKLEDLCKSLDKSETRVTIYLKDLVQAGFITADPTWNLKTMKSSTLKNYRLSDNYIRFYMKYINKHKDQIAQGVFKSISLADLKGWDTIMGLQFENLVINNVPSFLKLIGMKPSELIRFGPFFQRPTQRRKGCQIDLLIQASFRTIYICEVKFSTNPIGMDVVKQISKKQERISVPRGWSTRLVLIHVNGVTREVVQSGMFDYIVDFSQLG